MSCSPSAHGYLDTVSTSSLHLAVTFAVTGLSLPSWCNDRGYGPDSGTPRNSWRFHRCSSWTRCTRPLLLCGADGQTVQKTVVVPQLQFFEQGDGRPCDLSATSSGAGDLWRPRRLTAVSCRGLGVALTPGISPRCQAAGFRLQN